MYLSKLNVSAMIDFNGDEILTSMVNIQNFINLLRVKCLHRKLNHISRRNSHLLWYYTEVNLQYKE